MDATGTGVTVQHELINRNQKPYELAVWALTIMNPGGTAIVPQEPYKKHADALLPARPLVLWHYTDLSDSRYAIGPKFIRLSTDETKPEPQKFGVLNKTGWAAYARNGLLFVKRMKYEEGAAYPDYDCSVEVFTQAGFIEVESLGPLRTLKPGESAEHTERWSLHKDVKVGKTEAEVEAAIGKLTTALRAIKKLSPSPLGEGLGEGVALDFLLRPHIPRQHFLPQANRLRRDLPPARRR